MHDPEVKPHQSISTSQAKSARSELERALSLHFQGDRARAIARLSRALELDPALANERLTANLAHELTGLPAPEALLSLINPDRSRERIRVPRQERRRIPLPPKQRFMLGILAVAVMTFLVMCTLSWRSGLLGSYIQAVRVLGWQAQKSNLDGYDYFAIVPGGSPPAEGWPIVVALHGNGGRGEDMLFLADEVNRVGAILLAPTFDEYQPFSSGGPIEPMSRILTEVGSLHPLQARGAILLGFSQGGSFAYRFSVRHPEQVAGVVTAGAPEFDPIYPARSNMPYVFTWGELDWLQEYVLPSVYPMQNAGYNVRIVIVPGFGHEVSPYAIEQILHMLE